MKVILGSEAGPKQEVFDHLLEKGMVMVHLDSRQEDVDVPGEHRGNIHLRLNFSHNFFIDDFAYDEDGTRASLSFGGKDYFCVLPWSAIFALTSHVEPITYIWPENIPEELVQQGLAAYKDAPTAIRPAMSLIQGGGEPAAEAALAREEPAAEAPEVEAEPEDKGRRYGHLRVVK